VDNCRVEANLDRLAALQSGEIKDRGHETEKVLLALLNAHQVVSLRFVEGTVYLALQQLSVPEDRLEWRTELVA